LILASASPRRADLLREMRYDFIVEPPNIDEENFPPTTMPIDLAMHLSRAKADVVAKKFPDNVILAADTVVAFGDWIIGKPRDAVHARSIIELLGGGTHIVITGVCVVCIAAGFFQHARVMSSVRMKSLSKPELDRYIESKLWEGKAGAYGLQDPEPIVKCAWGDPTNVIGLPMGKTKQILADAGIEPYQSDASS